MNLRREHHAHAHSWIASKNAPTRNSGILPRRSTVPFRSGLARTAMMARLHVAPGLYKPGKPARHLNSPPLEQMLRYWAGSNWRSAGSPQIAATQRGGLAAGRGPPACLTPDVLQHLFCRRFIRPGFLFHLPTPGAYHLEGRPTCHSHRTRRARALALRGIEVSLWPSPLGFPSCIRTRRCRLQSFEI
jgi:hypothetical protein